MGFLMVLLFITALFLILLVLIQRGKGGGLAGAFGGMGGQSAFGTKAGDLFTKITIGVAAFWIILCMITVKVGGSGGSGYLEPDAGDAGGSTGAIEAGPPVDVDNNAGDTRQPVTDPPPNAGKSQGDSQ